MNLAGILKIAIRNILRYRRRSLLTAALIVTGVLFVLVFVSISGSFKKMMTGQITDSMLGHLQVHRKGYVASIENLPLNLNVGANQTSLVKTALNSLPDVESYSFRIKFGGMFSNFEETSNIRINGIDPDMEYATVPLFTSRIIDGKQELGQGEILVPELLAKGMELSVGDIAVVVATNRDGSVNGKQFTVSGILESATGPGGRDGYIHIDDASDILRMDEKEISEIAVRLRDFNSLGAVSAELNSILSEYRSDKGREVFEVHTWAKLSPFYNISRMIDLMTFFIQIMLIAIVLISIMNVMIMAVYERIREIGTMAAMGTLPSRILSLFIIEGCCLGALGAFIGCICGFIVIWVINMAEITFDFGRQKGLLLEVGFDFTAFLTVAVIVVMVSIAASLQPAFKASKMEPIVALRYN